MAESPQPTEFMDEYKNMPLPNGLEELSQWPSVLIQQKTSIKNAYRLLSPDGREVLFAKEDSNLLLAMVTGNDRSFRVTVMDGDGVEIIKLRRPYRLGQDKMEVTVCQQPAALLRQHPTFFKPVLLINDVTDRPVLRLKGPIRRVDPNCEYQIFDIEKRQVGVIRKKYEGFVRETFLNCTTHEIVFPANLDVRFKAALIGAYIMIDLIYSS